MATVQLSSGLRLILIDFHFTSHALCATFTDADIKEVKVEQRQPETVT